MTLQIFLFAHLTKAIGNTENASNFPINFFCVIILVFSAQNP